MPRKSKFADFPGVLQLSNGKLVFRHPLIGQRTMPDDIESEAFAAAYEMLRQLIAAPAPAEKPKAPTFRDAYTEWKKSDEWKGFDHKTRAGHERHAKAFLESPLVAESKATFGEAEIGTPEAEMLPLLRKHVASHAPHKAKRVAIVVRKIYAAAIEKEWCLRNLGSDLQRVELPDATPQPVWPADIIARFEQFHKPGTAARTCFALAKFMGSRKGDIARLEWSAFRPHRYIDESGIVRVMTVCTYMAQKNENNGKNAELLHVVSADLEECLNALDRSKGGTILKTIHGKPFSAKALTNQMAVWCTQAGIPVADKAKRIKGYTLHGLRHTFSATLAEGGVDPVALQKALGHQNLTTTVGYMKQMDAMPMAVRAAAAGEKRRAEIRLLQAHK